MKGIIYKVVSPSGNIYIGKTTKGLDIRRKQHFITAKLGSNTKFSRAIRKYGNLLIWKVIDEADNEESLSLLEINWIKYYNSYKKGYNSTLGGDGSQKYDNIKDAIEARDRTFKKYYINNSKKIYQRKKSYFRKYLEENREAINKKRNIRLKLQRKNKRV